MELAEAIDRSLPLQIRMPSRRNPLQSECRCVAEMFVVDSRSGVAVVWLEPFWHTAQDQRVSRIAYATPVERAGGTAWVDDTPRYGPFCIAYQRPFVVERLTSASPVWEQFQAWQAWALTKRNEYGRRQAWQRVAADLAEVGPRCLGPAEIRLPEIVGPEQLSIVRDRAVTASPGLAP